MQCAYAPKKESASEFRVEPAQYLVEKFDFGEAFSVSHKSAVIFDIHRIPRSIVVKTETKMIWSAESFFSPKTIEQLISEQGILPIADISVFAGSIPDEDVDEFVADIYSNRV